MLAPPPLSTGEVGGFNPDDGRRDLVDEARDRNVRKLISIW